tara:strand:- start:1499 stop:2086 length:588 start_codon:yes stop_codon:yes gene_type:complete
MIRIGVVGDIGSGKSFVARLFKYPVFNADREVNLIYNKDRECFRKLKNRFPKFIKSFPVKKKELMTIIKSDKKNLKIISSIVHPIVRLRMNNFLKKNVKFKMVILDIPLLIENNLNKKNDIIIFIKSNPKKILERLKKRPNFNKKVFKNLKENQAELLKKRKLAKYIVENNFSVNIMRKKINLLKNKILNERNSS